MTKKEVKTYKPKVGDYVIPIKPLDYKGRKITQWDNRYQISDIDKRGATLRAVRGSERPIWAVLKLDNIKELK